MKGRRILARGAGTIFGACLMAALAACGGSSSKANSSASAPAQSAMTVVRVVIPPQVDFAPLQLGFTKGLFKKHGIDLRLQISTNPANNPPAVISGQVEGGGFTWGSLAVVVAAKLPLVGVTGLDTGPSNEKDDFVKVVALKSSGITSMSQLAGKTVAVNTLGGFGVLHVLAPAKRAGIDPKSIKLIPVVFPDMPATLRAKRVDAITIIEPFLTTLIDQTPVNILAGSNFSVMPNVPYGTILMSKSYVAKNPDAVRRFQLAVKESDDYAASHNSEVRALLPAFSKIPAAAAQKILLPRFTTKVDPVAVQKIADLMFQFGLLHQKVDMTNAVAPFPLPNSAG